MIVPDPGGPPVPARIPAFVRVSARARPAGRSVPLAERGLGLIEVLIALVIVSFGVLGMAGLQLTGMKHSAGGLERSKALLFAENIAARMRRTCSW